METNSGRYAFNKVYEKLAYSYIFGYPPQVLDPFDGDLPFLNNRLPWLSDYDDAAITFLKNLMQYKKARVR